jgi:hypothetical protein
VSRLPDLEVLFVGSVKRSVRTALATDPEINTLDEIVEPQVERLRARNGRHLSPLEHRAGLSAIAAEVESLLAGRYERHLRNS